MFLPEWSFRKRIERSRIAMGGFAGNRCVEALLIPIRPVCRIVEAGDRRSARLGARYPFYLGMKPCYGSGPAGHKALAHRARLLFRRPADPPRFDFRQLMHEPGFSADLENSEAGPRLFEDGEIPASPGIPAFQETADRREIRRADPRLFPQVPIAEGVESPPAPLRITWIPPEQIGRGIPQEARVEARPGGLRRAENENPPGDHAGTGGCAGILYVDERAVPVDDDDESYLLVASTRRCDFVFRVFFQPAVQVMKRFEDHGHPRVSAEGGTSITPSRMCAWKKRGSARSRRPRPDSTTRPFVSSVKQMSHSMKPRSFSP